MSKVSPTGSPMSRAAAMKRAIVASLPPWAVWSFSTSSATGAASSCAFKAAKSGAAG
ncbi:hypothetical protein D3C85_700470 [compost metagenome]